MAYDYIELQDNIDANDLWITAYDFINDSANKDAELAWDSHYDFVNLQDNIDNDANWINSNDYINLQDNIDNNQLWLDADVIVQDVDNQSAHTLFTDSVNFVTLQDNIDAHVIYVNAEVYIAAVPAHEQLMVDNSEVHNQYLIHGIFISVELDQYNIDKPLSDDALATIPGIKAEAQAVVDLLQEIEDATVYLITAVSVDEDKTYSEIQAMYLNAYTIVEAHDTTVNTTEEIYEAKKIVDNNSYLTIYDAANEADIKISEEVQYNIDLDQNVIDLATIPAILEEENRLIGVLTQLTTAQAYLDNVELEEKTNLEIQIDVQNAKDHLVTIQEKNDIINDSANIVIYEATNAADQKILEQSDYDSRLEEVKTHDTLIKIIDNKKDAIDSLETDIANANTFMDTVIVDEKSNRIVGEEYQEALDYQEANDSVDELLIINNDEKKLIYDRYVIDLVSREKESDYNTRKPISDERMIFRTNTLDEEISLIAKLKELTLAYDYLAKDNSKYNMTNKEIQLEVQSAKDYLENTPDGDDAEVMQEIVDTKAKITIWNTSNKKELIITEQEDYDNRKPINDDDLLLLPAIELEDNLVTALGIEVQNAIEFLNTISIEEKTNEVQGDEYQAALDELGNTNLDTEMLENTELKGIWEQTLIALLVIGRTGEYTQRRIENDSELVKTQVHKDEYSDLVILNSEIENAVVYISAPEVQGGDTHTEIRDMYNDTLDFITANESLTSSSITISTDVDKLSIWSNVNDNKVILEGTSQYNDDLAISAEDVALNKPAYLAKEIALSEQLVIIEASKSYIVQIFTIPGLVNQDIQSEYAIALLYQSSDAATDADLQVIIDDTLKESIYSASESADTSIAKTEDYNGRKITNDTLIQNYIPVVEVETEELEILNGLIIDAKTGTSDTDNIDTFTEYGDSRNYIFDLESKELFQTENVDTYNSVQSARNILSNIQAQKNIIVNVDKLADYNTYTGSLNYFKYFKLVDDVFLDVYNDNVLLTDWTSNEDADTKLLETDNYNTEKAIVDSRMQEIVQAELDLSDDNLETRQAYIDAVLFDETLVQYNKGVQAIIDSTTKESIYSTVINSEEVITHTVDAQDRRVILNTLNDYKLTYSFTNTVMYNTEEKTNEYNTLIEETTLSNDDISLISKYTNAIEVVNNDIIKPLLELRESDTYINLKTESNTGIFVSFVKAVEFEGSVLVAEARDVMSTVTDSDLRDAKTKLAEPSLARYAKLTIVTEEIELLMQDVKFDNVKTLIESDDYLSAIETLEIPEVKEALYIKDNNLVQEVTTELESDKFVSIKTLLISEDMHNAKEFLATLVVKESEAVIFNSKYKQAKIYAVIDDTYAVEKLIDTKVIRIESVETPYEVTFQGAPGLMIETIEKTEGADVNTLVQEALQTIQESNPREELEIIDINMSGPTDIVISYKLK